MISLQFAREDGISSKLIEWYGHGAFSHVDAILADNLLLGARENGGVLIRHPGYAPFSKTLRVDLPCEEEIEHDFYNFVCAQVGKKYDMRGIFGFVLGKDTENPREWFCSELVCAGLVVSKYFPYSLVVPFSKITPPDLLLLCSSRVFIPHEEAA